MDDFRPVTHTKKKKGQGQRGQPCVTWDFVFCGQKPTSGWVRSLGSARQEALRCSAPECTVNGAIIDKEGDTRSWTLNTFNVRRDFHPRCVITYLESQNRIPPDTPENMKLAENILNSESFHTVQNLLREGKLRLGRPELFSDKEEIALVSKTNSSDATMRYVWKVCADCECSMGDSIYNALGGPKCATGMWIHANCWTPEEFATPTGQLRKRPVESLYGKEMALPTSGWSVSRGELRNRAWPCVIADCPSQSVSPGITSRRHRSSSGWMETFHPSCLIEQLLRTGRISTDTPEHLRLSEANLNSDLFRQERERLRNGQVTLGKAFTFDSDKKPEGPYTWKVCLDCSDRLTDTKVTGTKARLTRLDSAVCARRLLDCDSKVPGGWCLDMEEF